MEKTIENQQAALARNEELIVQELPEEVLVYDLSRDKAHCLNRTAAFVWNHCDGRTSADEIAKLMEEEWHTPVSADVVWFTLNKLNKADLLQERITMPQAQAGISRRSAVRRLAFGALLVPAVMSIVAPTAMAGASIPPACQACVKKQNGVGSCPSECSGAILGACFDNSGCGNGQQLTPPSSTACVPCLSGTFSPPPGPGGLTVSWSAPD